MKEGLNMPQPNPSRASQQGASLQLVRQKIRKVRKSAVSRGALDALDAAVEARGSTEHPSQEWQIQRPDVQDEFAIRTRRLLRRLEGELRALRAELAGRRAT